MNFLKENIEIILLVFLAAALAWAIFLQLTISRLKKNQALLFQGKKAKDLEKIILEIRNQNSKMDEEIKDLYEITSKIHSLADSSLYKVGLVRFNPFKSIGGDQSFALALLNGKNNGVVVSSLYLKEGSRTYAKAIKNGTSEKYPLSNEEKKAIEIAIFGEKEKKKKSA